MVNDADVSVATQRHITSEGKISLPVYRQVSGSRAAYVGLRSAGSAVSRCLRAVGSLSVCASDSLLAISRGAVPDGRLAALRLAVRELRVLAASMRPLPAPPA